MGSTNDATDPSREALRSAARDDELRDEKLDKKRPSFILYKSVTRSTFTRKAIEILGNIRTMHLLVLKHGKDYADRRRITKQDRDSIDLEVGLFMKECRESIEALKHSIISAEEKTSARPEELAGVSKLLSSKDLKAHQHGMVLILSEHLHTVISQFDQLRAGCFQETYDESLPRQRRPSQGQNSGSAGKTQTIDRISLLNDKRGIQNRDTSVRPEAFQTWSRQNTATHMLQTELTNLIDTMQETERKMLEVSALDHLFSTQVIEQAQQIEELYQKRWKATQHVEKGGQELAKAIEQSKRLYIYIVIIVFSLSVFFLECL